MTFAIGFVNEHNMVIETACCGKHFLDLGGQSIDSALKTAEEQGWVELTKDGENTDEYADAYRWLSSEAKRQEALIRGATGARIFAFIGQRKLPHL